MTLVEQLRCISRSEGGRYKSVTELCAEAANEIEHLRAALNEIAELGDVRADEAGMIARRAIHDQ